MPAFYDGQLFTINFKEEPRAAEQALLAHNASINRIYMVQIGFTPGHTPRQLTSDTEVLAAQTSGEIALTPTDEVYRCSVIGPKS